MNQSNCFLRAVTVKPCPLPASGAHSGEFLLSHGGYFRKVFASLCFTVCALDSVSILHKYEPVERSIPGFSLQ